MNTIFTIRFSARPWCMALLLSAAAVGCGGGQDPILGTGASSSSSGSSGTAAGVALGSAGRFGIFGGSAGMTNFGNLTTITGSGGNTADIGTTATGTSSIKGFHDSNGDGYTESPGVNVGNVTGRIYTCTNSTTGPSNAGSSLAQCDTAKAARADALTAYNELVAKAPGADPGENLAGLTLPPGVYATTSGKFLITGNDLTLDPQGDANAVWVFQMASSLTVGDAAVPRSIILAGVAQAKNVYWQVGSAAIINPSGGGTMVGTIIAQSGMDIGTAGPTPLMTLNGRALSLNAAVDVVNTVINVPAP